MTRVSPAQRRTAGLVVAVVGVVALAILFTRGAFVPSLGGHATELKMLFSTTGDLERGDPVRARGVEVGHVTDIALGRGGRAALVTAELTDGDLTPHRDATAQLRWRTFLGGAMYVDLVPGTPSAPTLGDGTLPVRQTGSQVQLDDLFEVFARPTPQRVRELMGNLQQGLRDRRPVRAAIRQLAPRVADLGHGLAPLRGERPDDLSALVDASGRALAGIGRSQRALAGAVDGGAATLGTVAAHRGALGAALAELPQTLDETDATLARLRTTLGRLDPVVASLTPAVRPLAATLAPTRETAVRARRLLAAATPLLRVLPAALDRLASASRTGSGVLAGLMPILARTRTQILPWLDRVDPESKLKTYEAIGPTASAATHGEFDNGGYFLPFPASGDGRGAYDLPCEPTADIPGSKDLVQCKTLAQLFGELATSWKGAR